MADIINVQPEEQKENPNYAKEMIDKAEGRDKQPEGETLLAGKYRSEDDLLKGIGELLKKDRDKSLEDIYKELESGLGKQKPTEDNLADNTRTPEQQIQQAEETVTKAGLNFEELTKEFSERGELSEDSYKKLTEAGLPKEMVDAYITGLQAIAEKQISEVQSVVGGEAQYNAMIEWAADNLSESEKKIFNEAITAGVDQARFAVEALHSRYTRANGKPPTSLVQGKAPSATSDRYESRAQLTRDMSDPRYASDPAFRKAVIDKLARSDIF